MTTTPTAQELEHMIADGKIKLGARPAPVAPTAQEANEALTLITNADARPTLREEADAISCLRTFIAAHPQPVAGSGEPAENDVLRMSATPAQGDHVNANIYWSAHYQLWRCESLGIQGWGKTMRECVENWASRRWPAASPHPAQAAEDCPTQHATYCTSPQPYSPFLSCCPGTTPAPPEPAPPVDPFFGELERRAVVFPRKPSAPPEPESAAPALSDSVAQIRHVGRGLLVLFRGDTEVRDVGPTPGIGQRDRDELIARYNAFPALTAQVASLVAENGRLRTDRGMQVRNEGASNAAHWHQKFKAAEQQLAAMTAERDEDRLTVVQYARKLAASEAALREAREDAARGRWMIGNAAWLREDGRTHMMIRVGDSADLSCYAMREAAVDAARAATKEPT